MTARKPKPYSETAFVPMFTGDNPYVLVAATRWTAKAARLAFTQVRAVDWGQEMRRKGWRIVKVRVTVLTPGQIKAAKGTRR